ncbi:hypothetical protein [Agromyces aureus]|uniref:Uncharacterized protein n=1 Tax=Agromyces aureus TaxID=453304 RepID=A0A191WBQ9_9MICO|nr:hypothetical protein [Agromyces aureus]ANJ25633.1 hypothetical protein ATC03_01505 [Agromyces aureus]
MSDIDPPTLPSDSPDGSTDISEERKRYTEQLGDGTPTGHATEDPHEDTDTASGGDPDDEGRNTVGGDDEGRNAGAEQGESSGLPKSAEPTRPEDVNLDDGTDPEGAPIDNPSG